LSTEPQRDCPPPLRATHPQQRLPEGTVDCHCHVFEDPVRYPLAAGRSYTPPLCTLDDYVAMCHTLGITRTVQVNASVYGFDNSATLDVIAKLGQDKARGVAGLAPDATAEHIAKLHEGGFRGMRLSTRVKGYGGMDSIEPMASRIAPFGWHLQLHCGASRELAEIEARLMKLEVPIVFDHLGSTRGGEGVGSPGFQAMLRVLKNREDAWVKISSFYRRSDAGPPGYDDMKPLAQALVDARPDRCVWGSNWPHPECSVTMPDDGKLVDVFRGWVPDEPTRRHILVNNPARLYGFDGKA
jgi:predicted TIM-barrel fold metal-dependent hydrolase